MINNSQALNRRRIMFSSRWLCFKSRKTYSLVALMLFTFSITYNTLIQLQEIPFKGGRVFFAAYLYKPRYRSYGIHNDPYLIKEPESGIVSSKGITGDSTVVAKFDNSRTTAKTCKQWKYDPADYTLTYLKQTTFVKSSASNSREECSYPRNEIVKKIVKSNGDVLWRGCTQATKRCREEPHFDYKRNITINLPSCCRKHLMDMLRTFTQILDRFGITNYLASGGVIGWYRNRQMVPYDPEFDIHLDGKIWRTKSWDVVLGILTNDYSYHYEYITRDKLKLYYSKTNNLTIDVWPYYIGDKHGVNPFFRQHIVIEDEFYTPIHMSLVFPLKKDRLGGVPVNIPGNTKAYLDETYGKGNWEIPYKCTKFKWGECVE